MAKAVTTSTTKAAKEKVAAPSTAAPVSATKQVAKAPQITVELISIRAHELFAQRGYIHGFDREDWLEAERQLRDESSN